jgi:hypothetical protein
VNVSVWRHGEPAPPRVAQAVFASPLWIDVLERNYCVTAPLFMVRDGRQVTGACLAYHHKAGGSCATVFVPHGAIWGTTPESTRCLIDAVTVYGMERGMRRGVVAYANSLVGDWRRWEKTTVILDLKKDVGSMFAALRKKSRYTIRKAADIFEVASGGEYLGSFFEIYSNRMRHKRLNVKSLAFLQDAFDKGTGLELLVALRGGVVEAGMVFCLCDRMGLYLWNGASPAGLADNANHLLMWEAVTRFGASGVAQLDLGESREGGGVYAFKTMQFGGLPASINYCDPFCPAHCDVADVHLPISLRVARHLGLMFSSHFGRSWQEKLNAYGRIL